jgi:CRISPR-associated protein Cas2
MEIIVTYDVNTETKKGRKRLRKVAQTCVNYGQRVQKSVFECTVNEMQMEKLKTKLQELIDHDLDSIRIYRLVEPREKYIQVYGKDLFIDFNEPMVF